MSDVAVVVGAGGEIGGACALALAPTHDVVVCVDRDGAAAERTAASIRKQGREAVAVELDAGAPTFAASLVARARQSGPVRSAVHAIAYEEHAKAADISIESIGLSLALGPLAAFGLFRELYGTDALAPGAGLTVIGSLHASHSFAGSLGYNLAQAALASLVTTLANEWAADGVRVNSVVPGWTRTRGESALYGDAFLDATAATLPLGRFGSADDVAEAVAFVSGAPYVSGASLVVDGALAASLARLPGADS